MILCGFELARGEKRTVQLPVNQNTSVTAILFCGAKEGKTLVATAGVHGCEYIGIQALRQLAQTLDPMQLCGQVILLPLVNSEGFYQGAKQVVPQDGINLNRAFPGDANGTLSAQIAAMVEALVYPEADLLVDLHSGDCNEMAMPFAYFPATAAPEVTQTARAAAACLSMEFRVASSAKNGLYSHAAQTGVPALLLERGGMGCWSPQEVNAYCQNVCELMHFLKIMPFAPTRICQREITNAVYLESEHNAFWYPAIKAGQRFQKGALLGELKSFEGQCLNRFGAQNSGVVLYYTVSLGVSAGEPLVAYGVL